LQTKLKDLIIGLEFLEGMKGEKYFYIFIFGSILGEKGKEEESNLSHSFPSPSLH